MSKQTYVRLIDDMDGSEAKQTIDFSLEGESYEIDLNDRHADGIRAALEVYVKAARRAARRGGGSGRRGVSSGGGKKPSAFADKGFNSSDVREWAQANGVAINDRGRIPEAVVTQFEEARSAPTPGPSAESQPVETPTKAPAKRAARKAAAASVPAFSGQS